MVRHPVTMASCRSDGNHPIGVGVPGSPEHGHLPTEYGLGRVARIDCAVLLATALPTRDPAMFLARAHPSVSLALLLLVGPAFGLGERAATPPSYTIGSIPPARIWFSAQARIEFIVRPANLGPGAVRSVEFSGVEAVSGVRSFDPASGRFIYVPAPTDATPFAVTFRAVEGTLSEVQTIQVTPLRPLRAEASVLGLEPRGPLPAGDSREFLDVSERVTVGSFWHNASVRPSVRDVSITGKTVVFAQGHASLLWNYDNNEDLRSMTIRAETLVVRGGLRLPGTNLAIYARRVVFDDVPEMPASSISTVPRSSGLQPAPTVNGRAGQAGGSLELFAANMIGGGARPRFLLNGGDGERAGQGRPGAAGADRATIKSIQNGLIIMRWTDDQTIYAHYDGVYNNEEGDKRWPGDGGDATPGGLPGVAGDGGSVTSNLDLRAIVENRGGVQGRPADDQPGGRGGRPQPAYRRYFKDRKEVRNEFRTSSRGSSAFGRNSAKVQGAPGNFTTLPNDLRWLDPLALQKVLLHVRRAYLDQHFDFVRETLSTYVGLIDSAAAKPAWAGLSVDARTNLAQVRDEMMSLLTRVRGNLDYFGNPAGWAPMLSFEVNKLAFDNEIPRALRVMYLNHWLGNRATTLQQKLDAMARLRVELRELIAADRAAYAEAIAAIPGLEFEARQVQDEINRTKTDIESLENELLPRARNVALLKKSARALGAVAEIVPYGQPYVGVVGSTVSKLTEIDPDAPWTQNATILGVNAAGVYAGGNAAQKARALAAAAEGLNPDAPNQQAAVAELQTLQKPLLDLFLGTLEQLGGAQSPSPEVEAELQRLLADEPAFRAMERRLRSLNSRKERFAAELTQLMQTVVQLSVAISTNLLTIDRLNRSIQERALALNPETLAYLAGMNERARDRLLKYHYFVARSYEYRLLRPYPGRLDLDAIVREFSKLASASGSPDLTPGQFATLQAVYEDQVSAIAFSILDEYNSNRPSLSAPVRLSLPAEVVSRINAGEEATLNLEDFGLFLPSQENIRIVDLRVVDLKVEYRGNRSDIFYGDLIFRHSGVSRLRRDGEEYLFRHHNESTRTKLEWSTRFDPYDGTLDPVRPAAADQSLLKALLSTASSSPSTEDLLMYSRPAANAEFTVAREVSSRGGADFVITSMRIEVRYDFTRASDKVTTLAVGTAAGGVQTRVSVGAVDRNGRGAGDGAFVRSYDVGTVVSVTAEAQIGQFVFDRWEGEGVSDPNAVSTTVALSSSRSIRPVYRSVVMRSVSVIGGLGTGSYHDGAVVPITAIPGEGYRFVRWEGPGIADPTAPSTLLTVAGDTEVEAVVEAMGGLSGLINISTRAYVGSGNDSLIPGFVVGGTGTKRILVRAVGPTLAAFGVAGALQNPMLTVYRSSNGSNVEIAANDDWDSAGDAEGIALAAASVGAFALPRGSADAAALLEVGPGAYSVVTRGADGGTGVALVEVYDADPLRGSARLVNVSGRAVVGTGERILIPGFVIGGDRPRRFLIRAVGPGLAAFGVVGALATPRLVLYRQQDGREIEVAANEGWATAANAADVPGTSAAVGAFRLSSRDAALLVDLEPGLYSAVASGTGGATGVALVEIYEIAP